MLHTTECGQDRPVDGSQPIKEFCGHPAKKAGNVANSALFFREAICECLSSELDAMDLCQISLQSYRKCPNS